METKKQVKVNVRNTIKKAGGRPKQIKSGAYRSSIKSNDQELRRYLRDIERVLIEDLGGLDVMSNKQKIQCTNVIRILHKLYLIDEWISKQDSIFTQSGELISILNNKASYLGFINSLSRVLQSLGLKDKFDSGKLTLKGYLKDKGKVK